MKKLYPSSCTYVYVPYLAVSQRPVGRPSVWPGRFLLSPGMADCSCTRNAYRYRGLCTFVWCTVYTVQYMRTDYGTRRTRPPDQGLVRAGGTSAAWRIRHTTVSNVTTYDLREVEYHCTSSSVPPTRHTPLALWAPWAVSDLTPAGLFPRDRSREQYAAERRKYSEDKVPAIYRYIPRVLFRRIMYIDSDGTAQKHLTFVSLGVWR